MRTLPRRWSGFKESPENELRDEHRRLYNAMNEKFLDVTQNMSEALITDVCVQVLELLDKLKKSTTIGASIELGGDAEHNPPVNFEKDGDVGRGSDIQRHAMGTRSNARGSANCNMGSSRSIHPAPAVATSFKNAMRMRMAELVENNQGANDTRRSIRRLSSIGTPATEPTTTSIHWTHLFYRSPTDEGMYDIFLNFLDPAYHSSEQRYDYLSFKRSDGSIPLHFFIVFIWIAYSGTLLWFADDAKEYAHKPTALLAIFLGMFTGLMAVLALLLRLTHFSFTYDIRMLQPYHSATERYYRSPYGQFVDDGMVVGCALSATLYMISQQLAPACAPGTTLFNLEGCSLTDSLAPEMVLSVIVVLVSQMLARGVSRLGLVCAWVIEVVTINISIKSPSYLWINMLLACIIAISYELERLPLRKFIKSVAMLEASEVNGQLKVALSKYQVRESVRALEAKRSMVRHIGHEIRTPLNIIGVGTDVLLKELKQLGPAVPRSVLEVVEGIEDASTAALEVVNELLMFEKLAAGMTSIETAPMHIVRFVETAMKQHVLPALAKKIDFQLSVDLRDADLGVNIDPVKMIVVFRNIFSNAIKFTDKGKKIEVRVTRKTTATGQELVLIACQDQGAGLSKANLKLLFGEGVQFHANKLQAGGGSGLGLFITKGIVMLHKGASIWAESEGEGKGCTFFVELPLVTISHSTKFEGDKDSGNDDLCNSMASIAADEMQGNGSSSKCSDIIVPLGHLPVSPRLPQSSPRFKPRVLIVDDSLMNRRMLTRMLESEGFACVQAVDGLAALAVVNRAAMHRTNFTPSAGVVGALENSLRSTCSAGSACVGRTDVILMDSNMPKMNGPDAIVEIRKLGFKFPILGVTGDENHASFMRAGADGVMMKPVKAAELMKVIWTALRRAVDYAVKDVDPASPREAVPPAVGVLIPRRVSMASVDDNDHLADLDRWLTTKQTGKTK